MTEPIREIHLANGLAVRFYDLTRRYFGDYHQVRVKICCDVPLVADLFDDEGSYQAALKHLGQTVQYLKEIEHQGVPTAATSDTVEKVIQQFIDHSLAYFESSGFPKKLAQSQLKRALGKPRAFLTPAAHV